MAQKAQTFYAGTTQKIGNLIQYLSNGKASGGLTDSAKVDALIAALNAFKA